MGESQIPHILIRTQSATMFLSSMRPYIYLYMFGRGRGRYIFSIVPFAYLNPSREPSFIALLKKFLNALSVFPSINPDSANALTVVFPSTFIFSKALMNSSKFSSFCFFFESIRFSLGLFSFLQDCSP